MCVSFVCLCARCMPHFPRLQHCAISLWSAEISTDRLWAMPQEHHTELTCLTWPRQKIKHPGEAEAYSPDFWSQMCIVRTRCDKKLKLLKLYCTPQPPVGKSICWMTNTIMYRQKVDDQGAVLWGRLRLSDYVESGAYAYIHTQVPLKCAFHITVSNSVDVSCC